MNNLQATHENVTTGTNVIVRRGRVGISVADCYATVAAVNDDGTYTMDDGRVESLAQGSGWKWEIGITYVLTN